MIEITMLMLLDSLPDVKSMKVFPPVTELDEINVSKSLLTAGRLNYPKVAPKSKLDDLLAKRIHLKTIEERINAHKKVYFVYIF